MDSPSDTHLSTCYCIKMKTAIIVGVNGQDGQLLYDYLKKREYCILGIDKDIIKSHNIEWKNKIDICSKQDVELLIKKNQT